VQIDAEGFRLPYDVTLSLRQLADEAEAGEEFQMRRQMLL
jgi:hypothetical protein